MASDEYRPPWLPVNPVPEPAETSDNAPEQEPDPVLPAESEAQPAPESAVESEDPPTPTAPPSGWPFTPEPAPEPEPAPAPAPAPEAATEPEAAPAAAPPTAPPNAWPFPPALAPQPEAAPPTAPPNAWPFPPAPAPEPEAAPAPEAAPPTAPPNAWPFTPAPSPSPTPTEASFADPSVPVPPTGTSPSPAAAAAFFGVRGDRAAAQRETGAVEPDSTSAESPSPAFRMPPRASEPSPEFEPAPAFVPPPAFEPWQRFEPGPPASETPPSETPPPEAPPTPQPPVVRTSPYLSGSLPVTDHGDVQPEVRASAQESWAPATPPNPPVTGSVPTVRGDDLTPTKPQMPLSAHSAAATPTPPAAPEPGQVPEPEPEPEPEQVAEPEPTADSIPTPIEADEDEIIAPILPPPDTEIMPLAGDDESKVGDALAPGTTPWSQTVASAGPSEPDSSPAPTDSVRQLGASAVSNASLQAAGAPTPTTGVPRVREYEDEFPSFGDEEPFVPRFEPSAGTTPTVSFAEPAPRTSSPLSDVDVPETDEPAYTPRVQLNSWPSDEPVPTRMPHADNTPVPRDAAGFAPPSESAPATPSRPWSTVGDDDVEFAEPTIHPGSGLPIEMADSSVIEPAEPLLPIPSRRAVNDSTLDEETSSDAPATESDPESESDAESTADDQDVAAAAPRKRRRWVWWLIGALLLASAAGILIYRMFLLPEPITLPVPTVTASPATPLGEPLTIADPTDFVASLPDTVQTWVLQDYASIDPLRESSLPARVAEHEKLSYGQGVSEPRFVVNAYQHYSVEDAQKAYDAWAADATDVEPVLVDGEQVGERALTEDGVTGTVVWRNVTAVFVLTGPAESVLDFYEHYGV